MSFETSPFSHEYHPSGIHFGRGSIDDIDAVLADHGLESALVVCGENTGANDDLMDPIRSGLGERLAGVFDGTTPEKSIETVFAGLEHAEKVGADVLVPVGGGSSLDTAHAMKVLAAGERSLADAREEIIETGTVALPADRDAILPTVPVPTTLAGADLSVGGGIVAYTDDGPQSAFIADEELMPDALVYDPDLFETTPMSVLAGSAINGFDKGVEAIYSRYANPVVDSTAVRGLKYLRSSLPELRQSDDPAVMEEVVLGTILVQYGVSMPEKYKINIVHAFGHGLRHQFGIQQGIAHAVAVPHVLDLIFDEGVGRPGVLAEGLVRGAPPEDPAQAVVAAVEDIRDSLELPSRLRDIDGTDEDGIPGAAEYIYEDGFLYEGPPEFDPSLADVEATLREMW